MDKGSTRAYRRRVRKVACRSCNNRHIRCESPELESPVREAKRARRNGWQCKACLETSSTCEILLSGSPRSLSAAPALDKDGVSRQEALNPNFLAGMGTGSQLIYQQTISNNLQTPDSVAVSVDNQLDAGRGSIGVCSSNSNQPRKDVVDMLLVKLVDSDNDPQGDVDYGRRVVCFGENSSYHFTIQRARSPIATLDEGSTSQSSMHYRVPDDIDQDQCNSMDYVDYSKEGQTLLYNMGALSLPPKHIQICLIETYFRWLHPSHQVLIKEDFLRSYSAGNISFLLMNALFFVATTCCDEDVLKERFGSHHAAQKVFFQRAKALYDLDHEKDSITVIQSLYFMSFYWRGPTEHRDLGHWLGAAITMGQARGLHRSTRHLTSMSDRDRSLWKRLWWALYIRDRSDSAAVGRPMLIHDDDCDVEMLQESDFEEEAEDVPQIFGSTTRQHRLYIIEMAKLSVLLGSIIKPRLKSPAAQSRMPDPTLLKDLELWQKNVPYELKGSMEESAEQSEERYWSSMLFILYHLCQILLHRPSFMSSPSNSSGAPALQSAKKISRIVEDELSEDRLLRTQVYLIPSTFAALTILYVSYRRSEGYRQRMVRQQIQTMMMGLSLLQTPWPFARLILKLFERILGLSENDRSIAAQESQSTSKQMHSMEQSISNGGEDTTATNSALPTTVFDMWETDQVGDYQNSLGFFDQSFWDQFGSALSPEPGF